MADAATSSAIVPRTWQLGMTPVPTGTEAARGSRRGVCFDLQRLRRQFGPCPLQVVYTLKVQPIVWRGAERLAKPDCHLGADRALAVDDTRDGIVRDMNVFGEFARADV
jgi:hypothetical protein